MNNWQDLIGKITCADCLDILKQLPDKCVDLVLTDPPYNVSRPNNFQTMGSAARIGMDFGEWDKDFDITGWIEPMSKTLTENANVVIFNAWENLSDIKKACEANNISIKRCLVLNKANPAPFNKDRMFVNDVEFALWGVYNSKNKPTGWTFNRRNPVEKCVIDTTVQDVEIHPTQKDIKVFSKLIDLLSNENDLVLDCFSGSGTTAVACHNLKRRFICIEKGPEYAKASQERLEQAQRQQMLF